MKVERPVPAVAKCSCRQHREPIVPIRYGGHAAGRVGSHVRVPWALRCRHSGNDDRCEGVRATLGVTDSRPRGCRWGDRDSCPGSPSLPERISNVVAERRRLTRVKTRVVTCRARRRRRLGSGRVYVPVQQSKVSTHRMLSSGSDSSCIVASLTE
jgi:hypothetical protein